MPPANKKRKVTESDSEDSFSDSDDEKIQTPKQECTKCKKTNILTLTSRASDNSYWTFPSGKEGRGYLPDFHSALGDSDGLNIKLCTDCGWIQNLDLEELRANIEQEENAE